MNSRTVVQTLLSNVRRERPFQTVCNEDVKNCESGFSTIEVLVALIILSSALLPIMQVFINLQQSTIRLEQIDSRNRAIATGLKYIRVINPGRNPAGEENLGVATMYWNSQLATDGAYFPQYLDSEYRIIGLYKMSVKINVNNTTVLEREIYQLGWSENAASPEVPQ